MVDASTPLSFFARLETGTVLKELSSGEQGLHQDEVKRRQKIYGPNALDRKSVV